MTELDPESESLAMRQMIQKKRQELQEETGELMKIESMLMMTLAENPKDEFEEPYSAEKIEKLRAFAKKKFLEYFDKHPLKKKIIKNKQN